MKVKKNIYNIKFESDKFEINDYESEEHFGEILCEITTNHYCTYITTYNRQMGNEEDDEMCESICVSNYDLRCFIKKLIKHYNWLIENKLNYLTNEKRKKEYEYLIKFLNVDDKD